MAGGKLRLPPRWFVVIAWHVHRWIVRATGGRKGLWPRRSGEPRSVIVGYYEDGLNLISIAMNGLGAAPFGLQGPDLSWEVSLLGVWELAVRGWQGFSVIARG